MKAIKVIAGIFIFVLAAIIALYVIGAISNDHTASATLKRIKEIPLPEETVLVDEISVAGKLVGNGNGVQYFGAIWIKSDLPLWQLEDYYSEFRKSEFDFIVEEQANQEINVIEHGVYKFDAEKTDCRHYIVYSWGSSNDALGFGYFDLRGN